jgi:hypothetical protein
VPAAPGSFLSASDGRAQHNRVRAARDSAREVAAATNTAVRDDVYVTTAGLVHVVTPSRSHVRDRGRHRRVHSQGLTRRVGCSPAETNEDARRARAHEVQGRRVRADAADDDGDIQLIDETLEIQGFSARRHMFSGHRRATDNEQVDARVHDRTPMLLDALGRQLAGDDHPGLAQLRETLRDERRLDRLRVHALQSRNRFFLTEVRDLVKDRLGILVPGPQAIQIKDTDATEATE